MSDIRQTIYITAYPKSGTTWLTRLLGDVLNSPAGGCMPSEDDNEIATEGQDRTGPYIIRKGHFVLIDDNEGDVVPSPHRLAWKQLTDEKIVFLVRDPRDICVSGAYHWRTTPKEFLERMIKGDVARCGRWDEYVRVWLNSEVISFSLDYSTLLLETYNQVKMGLNVFGIDTRNLNVKNAIIRQSFDYRSKGLSEQEMRRNNMRLGKAGDWKNHFTKEMNDRIWKEFGWMMERLGYEK